MVGPWNPGWNQTTDLFSSRDPHSTHHKAGECSNTCTWISFCHSTHLSLVVSFLSSLPPRDFHPRPNWRSFSSTAKMYRNSFGPHKLSIHLGTLISEIGGARQKTFRFHSFLSNQKSVVVVDLFTSFKVARSGREIQNYKWQNSEIISCMIVELMQRDVTSCNITAINRGLTQILHMCALHTHGCARAHQRHPPRVHAPTTSPPHSRPGLTHNIQDYANVQCTTAISQKVKTRLCDPASWLHLAAGASLKATKSSPLSWVV